MRQDFILRIPLIFTSGEEANSYDLTAVYESMTGTKNVVFHLIDESKQFK